MGSGQKVVGPVVYGVLGSKVAAKGATTTPVAARMILPSVIATVPVVPAALRGIRDTLLQGAQEAHHQCRVVVLTLLLRLERLEKGLLNVSLRPLEKAKSAIVHRIAPDELIDAALQSPASVPATGRPLFTVAVTSVMAPTIVVCRAIVVASSAIIMTSPVIIVPSMIAISSTGLAASTTILVASAVVRAIVVAAALIMPSAVIVTPTVVVSTAIAVGPLIPPILGMAAMMPSAPAAVSRLTATLRISAAAPRRISAVATTSASTSPRAHHGNVVCFVVTAALL